MKKIFSILSLVLMFACCNLALTSCGDDDEDEIPEDKVVNQLAGTWEYYEPGYPNTVRSLTLNEDGTFTLFTKDIFSIPIQQKLTRKDICLNIRENIQSPITN